MASPPPTNRLPARQSRRVQESVEADGDTWQETLAVCESPPPESKLIIRSYYQNKRTGKRVWDEPPSGASDVRPASEDMRKMATMQLAEMQVVTGAFENDNSIPNQQESEDNKKKEKQKRGFFGFRRKSKKEDKPKEKRKIQYKPGSQFIAKSGTPRSSRFNENNDAELQEAIARSIAESQGIEYIPGNYELYTASSQDEELDMAKAISMSEAEARGEKVAHDNLPGLIVVGNNNDDGGGKMPAETEEQQLQRALAASRIESDSKPAPMAPPVAASASANMKPPPSYAMKPPPPATGVAHAAAGPSPVTPPSAYPSAGGNNTQISPAQSPYFDPYHRDAKPAPLPELAHQKKPPPPESTGVPLNKMTANDGQKGRMSLGFGRRSSSKKMKDAAGVI